MGAGRPRRVEAIPKDVQSERVANGFRLNKVGVTGVLKPVQVRRPNRSVTLTTTLDVFVDLPHDQKGSHLSRNLEAINEVVDRSVREPVGSLEELTEVIALLLLKRHDYATTSEVWATAESCRLRRRRAMTSVSSSRRSSLSSSSSGTITRRRPRCGRPRNISWNARRTSSRNRAA